MGKARLRGRQFENANLYLQLQVLIREMKPDVIHYIQNTKTYFILNAFTYFKQNNRCGHIVIPSHGDVQ